LRFDHAEALQFDLADVSLLQFNFAVALSLHSFTRSGESGGCRKLLGRAARGNC
jgi:hypothetical protein